MSDTESDGAGPETLLKIIFVGSSGVGKTSLIEVRARRVRGVLVADCAVQKLRRCACGGLCCSWLNSGMPV